MEKTNRIFLIEATNNNNHQQNRANCFLFHRIVFRDKFSIAQITNLCYKINILFCNVDCYFITHIYIPGSFGDQVHPEHYLVIFLSESS